MATKKPAPKKKVTATAPTEAVEPEVEAQPSANQIQDEPEPADDEDIDPVVDGIIGRGYYERDGAFVRVHSVAPGSSIPLAVIYVAAEERAVGAVSDSDAPQLGLLISFQDAASFDSAGFRRVAREGVPLGWRKLLARVKP